MSAWALEILESRFAEALENWQLILAIVLISAPTATFIVTSIESYYGSKDGRAGREPPLTPYWIPFLGSWISFPMKKKSWLKPAWTLRGQRVIAVKRGPTKLYMVLDPELYAPLLRDARIRSTEAVKQVTMQRMFGTTKQGMQIYRNDDSGPGPVPLPGTKVAPHLRIWYQTVALSHQYLTGDSLAKLGLRFIDNLSAELAHVDPDDPVDSGNWVEVDDFYRWYTRKLLAAALTSLCGPHLLSLNPTFVDDYWAYIECWPVFLKIMPPFLSRAARRAQNARRRVLDAIKVWHAYACHNSGYRIGDKPHLDEEWNEYWGSPLMKARQRFGREAGMDADTLASYDLSVIAASSGNSLPAAFWNLVEIFADSELLERVRHELRDAQTLHAGGHSASTLPLRLDLTAVSNSALLQSLYAETLRLHVSFLLSRTPKRGDYQLHPYNLRQNNPIVMSSDLAVKDPRIWGTARCQRPLDQFWADRFLTRQEGEDGKANVVFSMEGLESAWIPYGGGALMCPGRHLAKQEIIGSVAIFTAYFDLELCDGVPAMATDSFGIGTQPPQGPVPVRLRRKVGAVEGNA